MLTRLTCPQGSAVSPHCYGFVKLLDPAGARPCECSLSLLPVHVWEWSGPGLGRWCRSAHTAVSFPFSWVKTRGWDAGSRGGPPASGLLRTCQTVSHSGGTAHQQGRGLLATPRGAAELEQRSRRDLSDQANEGERGRGWGVGSRQDDRWDRAGADFAEPCWPCPPGPHERSSGLSGAQPLGLDCNEGLLLPHLAGKAHSPDAGILGPALGRPMLGFQRQTSRWP